MNVLNKLLFIIILFTTSAMYAQTINWSGVVKHDNGEPMENEDVTLKFSILENATENLVYSETHSTQTNSTGFVNAEIGNGVPTQGTFSSIDWSEKFKLKTEIDDGNGNIVLGTSEMKSVPYANSSLTSGELKKGDNGVFIDENNDKIAIYTNGDGGVLSFENDGRLGISGLEGVDEGDVAVTAQGYLKRKESTTITKYISISAMDFIGEDFQLGINGIFSETAGNNETLPQAIHLPDNAVIKEVKAVYYDNSTTEINLILYKYTNANPALSIISFTPLPHGGNQTQIENIPSLYTVNNLDESYGIILTSDNWEANATKVGVKRIVIIYEVTE